LICAARLVRGGVRVHYQPVVELQSGEVIGAEALLPLHHPNAHDPPSEFVPLSEDRPHRAARRMGAAPRLRRRQGMARPDQDRRQSVARCS